MTSFELLILMVAVLVAAGALYQIFRPLPRPPPRMPPMEPDAEGANPEVQQMMDRLNAVRDEALDRAIGSRSGSTPLVDPSILTRTETGGAQNLDALEELLSREPDNVAILNLVAYQYYNSRRLTEARRLYERGLAVRPKDPVFLYYMANTCYLLGELPEAQASWEQVARLDPDGKLGKKARERITRSSRV